jgi:hypothetical protein
MQALGAAREVLYQQRTANGADAAVRPGTETEKCPGQGGHATADVPAGTFPVVPWGAPLK